MPTAPVDTRDTALETQVLWIRYRKEISVGLVVALLAVIGVTAWRVFQERRETASSEALAAAKTAADYDGVIKNYDDTPAAAAAYLLLAEAQRKDGKLTDANATLQRFLDKFPRYELAGTARMTRAANLQAMGKEDEAMAEYQQIATMNSGSFNAPRALLAQAKILQTKGRDDDARRVCETIKMQYQGSFAAAEALQLLGTLKPPASPAKNSTPPIAPPAASIASSPAKP